MAAIMVVNDESEKVHAKQKTKHTFPSIQDPHRPSCDTIPNIDPRLPLSPNSASLLPFHNLRIT
jgi:hypothetical protein